MQQRCPRLVLVWVLREVVGQDEAPGMEGLSPSASQAGSSPLSIAGALRGLCHSRCLFGRWAGAVAVPVLVDAV